MMKLPEQIKVGCYTFTIVDWESRNAEAERKYGTMSSTELVIKVRTDLGPRHTANTLLHELKHAIFFFFNLDTDDGEEHVVTCLANGMSMVMVDNPDLMAYFAEAFKE
jgi:hypothetical protein